MDPIKIYDYLVRSRERVLEAVQRLTPSQYEREFTIGMKKIGVTLTHIMISEWYYMERMAGRPVLPYEEWPIQYENPPALEVIDGTWREQTKRVRASIAAERDWSRRITYVSFPLEDGKRYHITATAGDFFTQLTLHEVHHRAQLMSMLREFAATVPPPQDIDYNDLMFERREA
jgi:uncharacterized damage-inducible protein DinB